MPAEGWPRSRRHWHPRPRASPPAATTTRRRRLHPRRRRHSLPQTETNGAQQPAAGDTVEIAAEPGGELACSLTAQAGAVGFQFTNAASVPHDFNIERVGERIDGTEVITADEERLTVELEPGRYTSSSVGGHRDAGMEGTLTVE